MLGTIPAGTHSTEFYWTDRWDSVSFFRTPAWQLRCYYCNVNRPADWTATLSPSSISTSTCSSRPTSLQGSRRDEHETHAAEFGYTNTCAPRVRASLSELLRLIETREFPFDAELGFRS